MKPITRADLTRRYGYFLDFLARRNCLDPQAAAGGHVTAGNVEEFVAELQARVGSVTQYGSVYKLRRLTQLIAPERDLAWLREVENDLALAMQPRSKYDRLVLAEILIEAGLTLMTEADAAVHLTALQRARQFRNGLMVALLAACPIRLKNFAALTLGSSFIQSGTGWWIVLDSSETKEARSDERPVPAYLSACIHRYIEVHRLVLGRSGNPPAALWISSNDGTAMTYGSVELAISQTTLSTLGVNVSPHLFRTSGATTAAIHAGHMPHLASAILNHRDPSTAEQHYIQLDRW